MILRAPNATTTNIRMLTLLRSLQSQFDLSAAKVAAQESASTNFEKFHVLTLDYRTPIVAAILYVLIVSFFSKWNRDRSRKSVSVSTSASASAKRTSSRTKNIITVTASIESRYTPFKCLVIAHNVFLCLYSAVTFCSVLPILLRPYFSESLLQAFCDVEKKTFAAGVHFWVWNFYVSKYYELLDTAILLIKGKPSSFLQTFHHSGSILGMWIMTTTHAPAAWIFVLFNSFIHTIMYFYYTLTCLGFRPTWKKILTTMQIIQFVVGNPLGLIYALLPGCLPLEIIPPENVIGQILGSQLRSLYACLFINTFFISSLVILFTDFSRKTYGTKNSKTEKSNEKKRVEKTSEKLAEKESVRAKSPVRRAKSLARKSASPVRKSVKSIKAVKVAAESPKPASAKKTKKTETPAVPAVVTRRTSRK